MKKKNKRTESTKRQPHAYRVEIYYYKCVCNVCIVIWLMSIQISSGESKGLQLIRANETTKMDFFANVDFGSSWLRWMRV